MKKYCQTSNIAIALDDQNEDYYRIRGEFLKDMGEMEKATEDFDSMIRLSPKEEDAYTNRGFIENESISISRSSLGFY